MLPDSWLTHSGFESRFDNLLTSSNSRGIRSFFLPFLAIFVLFAKGIKKGGFGRQISGMKAAKKIKKSS